MSYIPDDSVMLLIQTNLVFWYRIKMSNEPNRVVDNEVESNAQASKPKVSASVSVP